MISAEPGVAVVVAAEHLHDLLERADELREDPTGPAGPIRILRIGRHILVQESTPDGEQVVRRFTTPEAAERFVSARLAAYDRMWDGCGCKIDYLEVFEGS